MAETSDRTRLFRIAVAAGWVALGGAVTYILVGSSAPRGPVPAPGIVATFRDASVVPGSVQPAAPAQVADVDTMITRLAARLEGQPDDAAGWRMLAWSYFSTGNYAASVPAYARGVALDPENAELLSLYGEAMVRRDDGKISAGAQEIFDASLARDPMQPRALYFRGLALDQGGQTEQALALWLDLLDNSPDDADWLPVLKARIRERADATGHDLSGRPEFSKPAAPQPLSGPTAQEMQAAAQMTPQDRQAMIRGMVDGLAAKLATAPDDPEGWVRLIRAYSVLDEPDAAAAALVTARNTFEGRAEDLALLAQLAAELGLQ